MEGLYYSLPMSSSQLPCFNTLATSLRRPVAMDVCDNFINPGDKLCGSDCAVAAFQHLEPPLQSFPVIVNNSYPSSRVSSYQLYSSSSCSDPLGCTIFSPKPAVCNHGLTQCLQCLSCLTFEGQVCRVGMSCQTVSPEIQLERQGENAQVSLISFSPYPIFSESVSSHWHGFLPSFEETVSASGSPEMTSRTEISSHEPAQSKPKSDRIIAHQSISPTSSTEMSERQENNAPSVVKSCSSGSSFGTEDYHNDSISKFAKGEPDEHDSGGLFSSENIDFGDEQLSELLWESYLQNMQQPLVCLEPIPESYSSNTFSRELEEFDNFIASFKEIHENQGTAGRIGTRKGESRPSQKVGFVSFWDPLDAQDSLGSTVTDESRMESVPSMHSAKPRDEMKSLLYEMVDVPKMNQVRYQNINPSLGTSLETSTLLHQTPTMTLPTSVESVKVGKKRSRNGESARPRPKDRQRIQDCILELRGIIPSSKKCSIDALLEKTIKHINFLQTVKVKWNQSIELQEHEDTKPSTAESGTSWAVEVDEQGKRSPIIVENLSQPGQLLVEMLCEKKDLFLEITESIRSMGLTILKGVMEMKQDKTWAKFVVEGNQEVHRVQVLLSLMELLESTNTKASSDVSSPS